MRYRLGVLVGGVAVALVGLIAGGTGDAAASPVTVSTSAGPTPAASPVTASTTAGPTPAPTLTCPPALPVSGAVSAATASSLTISYSMLLTPPCGYNPPVTVTLFASREDAQQWLGPVAEAVSGPERNGTVTVNGLIPDTAYWFRFSADGRHDPYVIGSGRTAVLSVCSATLVIDNAWSGGFIATVTVRNVAEQTLDAWRVSWRWPGSESILAVWNGVTQDGGVDVTIRNASYNGTLPPGGSTTFGMVVAAGAPPGNITPACGR
jgi:chitodextrinase